MAEFKKLQAGFALQSTRGIVVAIAMVLAMTCGVRADDAAIDKLVEYHNANAPARLKELRAQHAMLARNLAMSKRAPITGQNTGRGGTRGLYLGFASKDEKVRALGQLEDEVARLKDAAASLEKGETLIVPDLPQDAAVGNVGRTPSTLPVVQIIDESTVVVQNYRPPLEANVPNGNQPNTVRVTVDVGFSATYVLEGVKTDGLIEGSKFSMPAAVEIVGTRELQVRGQGKRKLFVLRPVNTAPAIARLEPLRKSKAK